MMTNDVWRQQVMDCLPDAVLLVDHDFHPLRWNQVAADWFELDSEQENPAKLAARLTIDEHRDIQSLLATEALTSPSECEAQVLASPTHSKQEARSVLVRVSRLVGSEPGRLFLVTVTDISDQKRAELEAAEAIRGRDQFLAMLSHELRNPLSAILNAYEILRSPASGKTAIEEARHVAESQLKHLTRLLDDLLDVSRVVNHRLNLKLTLHDWKSIVAEAVESVRHQFTEKGQRLVVNLPNNPLPIHADAARLHQAHVNLLVNASKYSPAGSIIHVSAHGTDTIGECHIDDAGPGVPENLRERIFEPFVQMDQTLDRSEGGMGVGLALVKLIAQSHQGTVEAQPVPQASGSRFTLRLPLAPRESMPADEPESSAERPCRVLLIEDMADVRLMMVRALQLCGFEVSWAETGMSGIELLKNRPIDAAIVDIGLPDINGYEVARRVRSIPEIESTYLIAVTGYGMPEDIDLAHAAGFNLHMLKPIHFPELVKVLERVRSEATDDR